MDSSGWFLLNCAVSKHFYIQGLLQPSCLIGGSHPRLVWWFSKRFSDVSPFPAFPTQNLFTRTVGIFLIDPFSVCYFWVVQGSVETVPAFQSKRLGLSVWWYNITDTRQRLNLDKSITPHQPVNCNQLCLGEPGGSIAGTDSLNAMITVSEKQQTIFLKNNNNSI